MGLGCKESGDYYLPLRNLQKHASVQENEGLRVTLTLTYTLALDQPMVYNGTLRAAGCPGRECLCVVPSPLCAVGRVSQWSVSGGCYVQSFLMATAHPGLTVPPFYKWEQVVGHG